MIWVSPTNHRSLEFEKMASQTPPPLPRNNNLRAAMMLNLFLPGTGQLLLGQRLLGGVLIALFLGCFAGVLVIFLVDYTQYLKQAMEGDILHGNRLEQIGQVFQVRWLCGLLAVGVVVYLGALGSLVVSPEKQIRSFRREAARLDCPKQPQEGVDERKLAGDKKEKTEPQHSPME